MMQTTHDLHDTSSLALHCHQHLQLVECYASYFVDETGPLSNTYGPSSGSCVVKYTYRDAADLREQQSYAEANTADAMDELVEATRQLAEAEVAAAASERALTQAHEALKQRDSEFGELVESAAIANASALDVRACLAVATQQLKEAEVKPGSLEVRLAEMQTHAESFQVRKRCHWSASQ